MYPWNGVNRMDALLPTLSSSRHRGEYLEGCWLLVAEWKPQVVVNKVLIYAEPHLQQTSHAQRKGQDGTPLMRSPPFKKTRGCEAKSYNCEGNGWNLEVDVDADVCEIVGCTRERIACLLASYHAPQPTRKDGPKNPIAGFAGRIPLRSVNRKFCLPNQIC